MTALSYFTVGPSALVPGIEAYVRQAFASGLLSTYHRSEPFRQLLRETFDLLHEKLSVPKDYVVVLTSSATEAWRVVTQSFVKRRVFHAYNGGFGEKWFEHTRMDSSVLHAFLEFPMEEELVLSSLPPDVDVLCLTQNETANGTYLSDGVLRGIRSRFPDVCVVVDVTSSLGALDLPWRAADIWLASVQKGLGLPAGLGLMFVSPRAVGRAQEIGRRDSYHSFLNLLSHFKQYEPPYTPNTLGIFLLRQMLVDRADISVVHAQTCERYGRWQDFFHRSGLESLVGNEAVKSRTVLTIKGEEDWIRKLHDFMRGRGYVLSQGYAGQEHCVVRVSNFPALSGSQIRAFQRDVAHFLGVGE